jgi:hypothetical protein
VATDGPVPAAQVPVVPLDDVAGVADLVVRLAEPFG